MHLALRPSLGGSILCALAALSPAALALDVEHIEPSARTAALGESAVAAGNPMLATKYLRGARRPTFRSFAVSPSVGIERGRDIERAWAVGTSWMKDRLGVDFGLAGLQSHNEDQVLGSLTLSLLSQPFPSQPGPAPSVSVLTSMTAKTVRIAQSRYYPFDRSRDESADSIIDLDASWTLRYRREAIRGNLVLDATGTAKNLVAHTSPGDTWNLETARRSEWASPSVHATLVSKAWRSWSTSPGVPTPRDRARLPIASPSVSPPLAVVTSGVPRGERTR